jgi:enoyl-CoA hydratase
MVEDITEGHLLVELRDNIHWITFNRPERLNAINRVMHTQLEELLPQIDEDIRSEVIVFTGTGRAFSAGGDVKSMAENGTGWKPGRIWVKPQGAKLVQKLLEMEKPTISMVNGPCVAVAASIALSTDCIVMAEDATIGDTHVNVGLVAGDGGTTLWPMLIGPHRAKEMLMSGRLITGIEAAAMGLVNRAVPRDQLEAAVLGLAREFTSHPTYAVRATKVAVNKMMLRQANLILELSLAYEYLSMNDAHREAVSKHRTSGQADQG